MRKILILLVCLVAALTVGSHQHHQIQRMKFSLEEKSRARGALENRLQMIRQQIGMERNSLVENRGMVLAGDHGGHENKTFTDVHQKSGWQEDQAFTSLSKGFLKDLQLESVSWNEQQGFQITQEASGILGLSQSEEKQLNAALNHLFSAYFQLELEKAELVSSEKSGDQESHRVNVPAFPEEGRILQKQFAESLLELIGPTRTELLIGKDERLGYSWKWLGDELGRFGRREKNIFFTETTQSSGDTHVNISLNFGDSGYGFDLPPGFKETGRTVNYRRILNKVKMSGK